MAATSELEIWRAANQLIQQHGDRAYWNCCARVDQMIVGGDPDGEAVWKRVLRAIRELQRHEPRHGELVN